MLRQRREIRPFIYVKKRHIKWKQENKELYFFKYKSRKKHKLFELLDAAENERREVRSLFPLIQAERSHIIMCTTHCFGKWTGNKILISLNLGQERTDII